MNAVDIYRVGHWCYKHKIPLLPKLFHDLNYVIFKCHIPVQIEIGAGTKFGYGGMGCVVHQTSSIGRDCIIGYGTTLGSKTKDSGGPVIGDSVYIATGAKLLGRIHIGDGAVIGANAVVTIDVPDRCIAYGVPAKVMRDNIDVRDISTHIHVNENLAQIIDSKKIIQNGANV